MIVIGSIDKIIVSIEFSLNRMQISIIYIKITIRNIDTETWSVYISNSTMETDEIQYNNTIW